MLSACAKGERRLPDPAWVSESALASVPPGPTTWPDSAWSTVEPGVVGLSRTSLELDVLRIRDSYPDVRALLVVVDGRLAFERYFGGARPDEPIEIKSITKSIVSALVGVALDRGELPSLDQSIAEWFPAEADAIRDPRVRSITLKQALSMTTGFEWQENGPATGEWIRSDNQVRYSLGSRLVAEPGDSFNYNTGVAHLVAVALARAVKTDLAAYAERMLFAPIGIRPGGWGKERQGNYEGGSELRLTARDLARFGLLYLNRGRWKDTQVVPEAWVLESTRPQGRVDYGYYWWYLPAEWGGPAVNALGYGGQVISIVPDANAVIVIGSTATNPDNPVVTLLREQLIPSVRLRTTMGR